MLTRWVQPRQRIANYSHRACNWGTAAGPFVDRLKREPCGCWRQMWARDGRKDERRRNVGGRVTCGLRTQPIESVLGFLHIIKRVINSDTFSSQGTRCGWPLLGLCNIQEFAFLDRTTSRNLINIAIHWHYSSPAGDFGIRRLQQVS